MKPKLLLSTSRDDPAPYVEAFQAAGAEPTAQYCPQYDDHYDALVLCGGCDVHPRFYGEEVNGSVNMEPQRDEAEYALIRAFLAAGKPIFGICRGCQLLNVYFGGTLYQDLPSQIPGCGQHRMEAPFHRACHQCIPEAGTPMADWGCFGINSHHHQAIKDIAPGYMTMGKAEDGVIEAIFDPAHPFRWGVQWHPERIWDIGDTSAAVFRAFIGSCMTK